MNSNPLTLRFRIGATYRLRSSPDFPRLLNGTMTVRSQIKPTDQWGNRIILADFMLKYPDGRIGTKLSARCFVEEGYSELADSYGARQVPTEIANLQGIYPLYAKAYAVDEIPAEKPKPSDMGDNAQDLTISAKVA